MHIALGKTLLCRTQMEDKGRNIITAIPVFTQAASYPVESINCDICQSGVYAKPSVRDLQIISIIP